MDEEMVAYKVAQVLGCQIKTLLTALCTQVPKKPTTTCTQELSTCSLCTTVVLKPLLKQMVTIVRHSEFTLFGGGRLLVKTPSSARAW